ncbi:MULTISPECIES: hypothetical protein [Microbacterium]|uniref:hypothetical protein n=1 Tax=Microbacterium TaxID=33882 RepID=UPI000B842D20|nr:MULTISPECIES: hypothetical protein [Microbacterium]MBT2494273.1 hypothetical protein [Microbacterium sp. ISL-59]NJI59116.1 hypothetical protein [Microbacterium sp. B19(2022)]
MNTTLRRNTAHPPDTEDREVFQIPRDDELRRLALTDRLSLRIGLWLLQRSQRPRRQRRTVHIESAELLISEQRRRAEHELGVLTAFALQRGIR